MKQLTPREEAVMKNMWAIGREATAREILEQFDEPRPHFNTVATFLKILERKGWVAHRPIGNTHLYRAVYSEEELGCKSLKTIASKFFKGSMAGMVSALLKEENLSDAEIEELSNLINSKKKD